MTSNFRPHPFRFAILFLAGGVLLFLGHLFLSNTEGPLTLSATRIDAVASVIGISTSVPSNEYNTLAQALTDKERVLNEREILIKEKEDAIARTVADNLRRDNVRTLLFVGASLFVLFILVGLNFYFDMHRRADERRGSAHSRVSGDVVTIR